MGEVDLVDLFFTTIVNLFGESAATVEQTPWPTVVSFVTCIVCWPCVRSRHGLKVTDLA